MKNGGVHAADREGETVASRHGVGTRREGGNLRAVKNAGKIK